MKKKIFILIFLYIINISSFLFSLDYSSVLGFSGIYRENSWTPLIIRISNNNQSVSGRLVVETSNSSTTIEQFRQYIKPAEFPTGAVKEFSFVIPIGHHNKEIIYYFESEGTRIFEERIELKQKGIRKNFVLGVSPYPDLGFLNNHPKLNSRPISYPHIDNLPRNSNGYKSVDVLSIHRELMDRLTIDQYNALTGWVHKGGILVVWGGKSPSPSKWDILPSEISGLRRLESTDVLKLIDDSQIESDYLLINMTETPGENKLVYRNELDLISHRQYGIGSVFFLPFDYSGIIRNWAGLNKIWDIVFDSITEKRPFQHQINDEISVDDYITIFDDSGFAYIDRINVALILFLSASATASILIFIRFRRKSRNIHLYIGGLILFLLALSAFIFITLFNSNFRRDSFVITVNVLNHYMDSEDATLYKDIFIGSSSKTTSDILIRDDTKSVVKQNNVEKRTILETPELSIENFKIDQWSSKIIRLESTVDSAISVGIETKNEFYIITVTNTSDYFIKDTFLLFNGKIIPTGNILEGKSKTISVDSNINVRDVDRKSNFNSNPLLNRTVKQYINSFDNQDMLLFCGFINDEINPLEFSNKTWYKKVANLITFSINTEEVQYEKPSF